MPAVNTIQQIIIIPATDGSSRRMHELLLVMNAASTFRLVRGVWGTKARAGCDICATCMCTNEVRRRDLAATARAGLLLPADETGSLRMLERLTFHDSIYERLSTQ
jgi:hypothetical protein